MRSAVVSRFSINIIYISQLYFYYSPISDEYSDEDLAKSFLYTTIDDLVQTSHTTARLFPKVNIFHILTEKHFVSSVNFEYRMVY